MVRRYITAAAGFRTLDMRMVRLTALVALLLAVLVAPAQAANLADTKRVLAREMARAGTYSGAYVVDLGTGQELYASKADTARMPASVEKLYTSATAMLL
jgi:D-alanyl-D-alanine carboxypeptidase/D-alanyl-D-alanine-endopeptidase (penicillin-binding protein 4)